MHPQWRPTCRRRRRCIRLVERMPRRRRSHGRCGAAQRATSHVGEEAGDCARGRRGRELARSARAPSREHEPEHLLDAIRVPGHPARERGTPPRADRASRRRDGRRCERVRDVRVPSTPGRARAHARRTRWPSARSRTRDVGRHTLHTGVQATALAIHSVRRPAERAASVRRGTWRTGRPPARRRRHSARGEGDPAPARLERTRERVTSSCQIGAEMSSRRSLSERSRSAGVLIGRKRPRSPRRGTSRY